MELLGCCGHRNNQPKTQEQHGSLPVPKSYYPPADESVCDESAMAIWRIKSDETHTALLNSRNGIVIELLHSGSKGWFHCRTSDWQMYTVYSDGRTDCPRVQVLDSEHLISALRKESNSDSMKLPDSPMGFWTMRVNEQGQLLVTHMRQTSQLLVLMKIGFVFIGSGGAALLIDDGGLQRLAATDVASMVQKA